MTLSHHYYDPFSDFSRHFDDAYPSRFFRTFRQGATETDRNIFRPKMDVHENAETNTVTVTFDLPGVKREGVNIDVQHDRLSISGVSSSNQQCNEDGYTVRERSCGKFSRTLVLPQGTKPEDIKAKLEHGVLSVTFPKGRPQQSPKRIAVE